MCAANDLSTPRYRICQCGGNSNYILYPVRLPAVALAPCHLVRLGMEVGAHGEEVFGDIPNFTDVEPVVQVNEELA